MYSAISSTYAPPAAAGPSTARSTSLNASTSSATSATVPPQVRTPIKHSKGLSDTSNLGLRGFVLTNDLLDSGMRTPGSVSSLQVESGSVGSSSYAESITTAPSSLLTGEVSSMIVETGGGDITPVEERDAAFDTPPVSTPVEEKRSFSPQLTSALEEVAAANTETEAEVEAEQPPSVHSTPPRGKATDEEREEATEQELHAYEAEETDRPRPVEEVMRDQSALEALQAHGQGADDPTTPVPEEEEEEQSPTPVQAMAEQDDGLGLAKSAAELSLAENAEQRQDMQPEADLAGPSTPIAESKTPSRMSSPSISSSTSRPVSMASISSRPPRLSSPMDEEGDLGDSSLDSLDKPTPDVTPQMGSVPIFAAIPPTPDLEWTEAMPTSHQGLPTDEEDKEDLEDLHPSTRTSLDMDQQSQTPVENDYAAYDNSRLASGRV